MSKEKRGFQSLSKEELRRIAHLGGKAAHKRGTAHEFLAGDEGSAARAGRIGGKRSAEKRKERERLKRDLAHGELGDLD